MPRGRRERMVDFDPNEPATLETVFRSIDPVRVRMSYDLLKQAGIDAFILDGESSNAGHHFRDKIPGSWCRWTASRRPVCG
jgi:hypothetical protein